MKTKDFYSEIGKLLYAVADIDGVITKEEKEKLQEIIRKELAPMDNKKDEFGTDVSYYTEIEFEILDDEIADAEAAFNSFIDFVEDHESAIDEKMKKISLRIAKELAAAYHGTNRKEKELIHKLKDKLEHIPFRKSNS